MNKVTFILLTVILFSCRKEESTDTISIIKNAASSTVIILPYYQGLIVKQDSVSIIPNESSIVLSNSNRGKGSGLSYPRYLELYESIVVKFDVSIKAVHYNYATSNLALDSKAIKYNNSRSLYNEGNYVREITMETKQFISNRYTFTFTEQDYLNEKSN